MKFTSTWLRDHLETSVGLDELCASLTMIGLEVEKVDDPRAKLSVFVIGEVVECQQHPNADRLRVCQVTIGEEKLIQVVCGAPNARQGMKGVFVAPGNHIPGTGILLKAGKIRGMESNGMLCSERELEISDEHDGIIELPADAPVGMAFVDYRGLDDPVIEVALTPNRGDCASVRGIARDLAAAGIGTLKALEIPEVPTSLGNSQSWVITPGAASDCPQVGGRSFEIEHNPVAPQWLQRRLLAIGLRPISALVDITNYLTHDIGRPLHAFDADKLHGNTLTMRHAKAEESLLCLDGKRYNFTSDDLVIADDDGAVSLAGIIGGEDSSCNANTRRVFLEAASFKASSIARTGRRLGIESDARFRFERKVDPDSIELGLCYASHLIAECCGGRASATVWAGQNPEANSTITLRPSRLAKISGVVIKDSRITGILEMLGCTVEHGNDDDLEVTSPSWRSDITLESCLIEEVLRIHGYDNIPAISLPPPDDTVRRRVSPEQRRQDLIRRRLAQVGLDEVITLSFVDEKLGCLLSDAPLPRIANPIHAEMASLRPSPLAGLLQAALQSYDHRRAPMAIFQIGPGWTRTAEADLQIAFAAGLRLGAQAHWQNMHQGGNDPRAVQADCLAVLNLCGLEQPQLRREVPKHYHPYRSGGFFLGKKPLAYFGNLHPKLIEVLGLKLPKGTRIAVFEILLDNLPPAKIRTAIKPPLEQHALQPLRRDFSFTVPDDFAAGELVRTIQAAEKKLISTVTVFDVYQQENARAVAYRVTFQPRQDSFTETEINDLCQKIIANVERKSPARLR